LDIAEKLDARYFGRELPCKFKFGVTGCINNCLKMEENDFGVKGAYDVSYDEDACIHCGLCAKVCRENAITFEGDTLIFDESKCSHCGRCVKSCPTDAWKGKSAFRVFIGGTFGNHIITGKELTPLIKDEATLMRVADATIDYFATHSKKGERFGKTLERLGTDELQGILEAAAAEA
jgi:anaerobic sulfite reductase subunit C